MEKKEVQPARGNWTRQFDFILSCVGYAIGFGNVWRFPYLCMRNGGGAFLIPYFICLLFCGIPMFFMEMDIGQFSSLSPLCVWKMCPLFRGIGWGTFVLAAVFTYYYNLILAWVLYYLGNSFTSNLPWTHCDNPWNTENCVTRTSLNSSNSSPILHQPSVSPVAQTDTGMALLGNVTQIDVSSQHGAGNTAAEEFWQYNTLELSSGIGELGGIRWQLALCLLAAWIIVFLCIIKGIKSSSKVVYVTVTLPYLLLVIMLIRGLLLPGSLDGIKYYLIPDWNRLAIFRTWAEACLQIFYSLGPGWGSVITFSSYNRFNNNCIRDAIIIPVINCGTSFLAGLVVFSIIGFMAHDIGASVQDVITSGPGLVFIAYPEALSRLPISPMWAVMFFIMLLTVGLDTQFGTVETISSGIADSYKLEGRTTLITAVICLVQFLLGLILVTRAGMYYFQIIDWYCGSFALMVIATLECLVVGWVYGYDRFSRDVEMMIGHRPSCVWRLLICFITPTLICGSLVYSTFMMVEPTYGDYTYPGWAIGLGWFIAVAAIIPIIIIAIINICHEDGPFLKRIQQLLVPAADWGPANTNREDECSYKLAPMDTDNNTCVDNHDLKTASV